MFRLFLKKKEKKIYLYILIDFPTSEYSEYLNQKSGLESKPLLKIERVPLELNLRSKMESELEQSI